MDAEVVNEAKTLTLEAANEVKQPWLETCRWCGMFLEWDGSDWPACSC